MKLFAKALLMVVVAASLVPAAFGEGLSESLVKRALEKLDADVPKDWSYGLAPSACARNGSDAELPNAVLKDKDGNEFEVCWFFPEGFASRWRGKPGFMYYVCRDGFTLKNFKGTDLTNVSGTIVTRIHFKTKIAHFNGFCFTFSSTGFGQQWPNTLECSLPFKFEGGKFSVGDVTCTAPKPINVSTLHGIFSKDVTNTVVKEFEGQLKQKVTQTIQAGVVPQANKQAGL